MTNIRILTAAALFDGHDVSINLFRRLMQKRGAEVINLGHNRSVNEVITTAIQEDVDAMLISSYQGGHNEYFKYIVDELKRLNASKIMVFGGGGGVILPKEIEDLENYGVERLYHATDGQQIGIDGIADDIMLRVREYKEKITSQMPEIVQETNGLQAKYSISRVLSYIEENYDNGININEILSSIKVDDGKKSLVLGVTGTGGSGKSSLIDEIIGRFISYTKDLKIAVLAIDPSKSSSGGALLGDRIRYNQIYGDRIFFRSFATRSSSSEISASIDEAIKILKAYGYELIIVETSGIGQGNSRVTEISDKSMYVMTAEFGAPSQLEKIDMLDKADFIAINKFEKQGSEDAYREVLINYLRAHEIRPDRKVPIEELGLPVFACSSNQFNNHGVNKLFKELLKELENNDVKLELTSQEMFDILKTELEHDYGLLDNRKTNYLSEISTTVREYKEKAEKEAELAHEVQAIKEAVHHIEDSKAMEVLKDAFAKKWEEIGEDTKAFLANWQEKKDQCYQDELKYKIQDKEYHLKLYNKTLSGTYLPKVLPPSYNSWGELVKYKYLENFPGEFPYTAGVFPFKRTTEDPKRQFAGEGSAQRTNTRFHYLTTNDDAKRLSVAFDGITLYGENPALNPDIYGKIGESGVSICTLEDMDKLLEGFDLTDPLTSVSMTINAPAPIMVAFYFITAYRRELNKIQGEGTELNEAEKENLKLEVFRKLRGTVQADMLKEDQGQNTCIFSIDFALKLIGDLQEYLSKNKIKNYYSLSISGYHIAEAGANPISQLAFTLANGFTYVEYFLNRGLHIDDFAPNLSYFFSNGMEPEYSVIGRVARRIWAIAMRDRYGANSKSQKLKYHIQTSGRSLHAQEIDFNDIRTTLQGLIAFNDNCNSLHTNSYDEAVTTPTEESVRRSMAIQMILAKEFGMLKNENPNQGSFLVEYLTDIVEEAVLEEFDKISRRGGVLGAMETQYQRSKIQEESMHYEAMKQSGEYPLVGINTYINEHAKNPYDTMQITRATKEEKEDILTDLNKFQEKNNEKASEYMNRLKKVALSNGNIFEELLHTVEYVSMGDITQLLYEIGGKYRRGM